MERSYSFDFVFDRVFYQSLTGISYFTTNFQNEFYSRVHPSDMEKAIDVTQSCVQMNTCAKRTQVTLPYELVNESFDEIRFEYIYSLDKLLSKYKPQNQLSWNFGLISDIVTPLSKSITDLSEQRKRLEIIFPGGIDWTIHNIDEFVDHLLIRHDLILIFFNMGFPIFSLINEENRMYYLTHMVLLIEKPKFLITYTIGLSMNKIGCPFLVMIDFLSSIIELIRLYRESFTEPDLTEECNKLIRIMVHLFSNTNNNSLLQHSIMTETDRLTLLEKLNDISKIISHVSQDTLELDFQK